MLPVLDQGVGLAEQALDCLHAGDAPAVHHGHPVLILVTMSPWIAL